MSTYSNKMFTFEILDDLKVDLEIQDNPFLLPLEGLFLMAARMNKKRSFLFVSKVLGKHIPIEPTKGILVGALLAARYLQVVKGKSPDCMGDLLQQFNSVTPNRPQPFIAGEHHPIVIGFAETATALGHAFFDAFKSGDFFHTTREWLPELTPTIAFEEEHSHATSHRAYIDEKLLQSKREIILVDDEVTTGKTAINIIRSIHEKFPRPTYTVVSILDWRSEENIALFREVEKELGITIHSVSLVKGTVNVRGKLDYTQKLEEDSNIEGEQKVSFYPLPNPSPVGAYTKFTGRFGLTAEMNAEASKWMEEMGRKLEAVRKGRRTLVLGAGEFMYLPMKIASFMGSGVFYHSSTRSPIFPNEKEQYGAQNRFVFSNPEAPEITHYLYNIGEKQYDEIFLFFERKVGEKELYELLHELRKTEIENINIVYLKTEEGDGENGIHPRKI